MNFAVVIGELYDICELTANSTPIMMGEPPERGLPKDEEERLERWFRYLDVDEDGKISAHDLAKALKALQFEGIHDSGHAQVQQQ